MKTVNKILLASAVAMFLPLTTTQAAEHSGHDMSQHQGHDMSKHTGHDMSQHTGHSEAATAGGHLHHGHGKGGWMFEYRFMRMDMDGLLQGSDGVTTTDVSGMAMAGMGTGQTCPGTTMELAVGKLSCMAPSNMTMDMHMVMGMYGVSDQVTLMVMFNYLQNDMGMVMHMPTGMTMAGEMSTSGSGDTVIGAMYKVDNNLTASLDISIPTGATDEMTLMKMANGTETAMRAPYAMQLGSGTVDAMPSLTYTVTGKQLTYGAQGTYTLRTGENDEGYTLGNRLEVSGFMKAMVNNNLMLTGRLTYQDWDKIDGVDPMLDMGMMKLRNFTNDATNSGGSRTDLSFGAGLGMGNHLLGMEVSTPIQQSLDGTQMKTQSIINFNYQYMMM